MALLLSPFTEGQAQHSGPRQSTVESKKSANQKPWSNVYCGTRFGGRISTNDMAKGSPKRVESGATTSAVFILRTATANPARLASAVRDALWSVDRALPVFDIRTMEQIVAGSLATRRFAMALLVSFAGLALGLAVIGLYAV